MKGQAVPSMLRPYFLTLRGVSDEPEERVKEGYARGEVLRGIDAPLEPTPVSNPSCKATIPPHPQLQLQEPTRSNVSNIGTTPVSAQSNKPQSPRNIQTPPPSARCPSARACASWPCPCRPRAASPWGAPSSPPALRAAFLPSFRTPSVIGFNFFRVFGDWNCVRGFENGVSWVLVVCGRVVRGWFGLVRVGGSGGELVLFTLVAGVPWLRRLCSGRLTGRRWDHQNVLKPRSALVQCRGARPQFAL